MKMLSAYFFDCPKIFDEEINLCVAASTIFTEHGTSRLFYVPEIKYGAQKNSFSQCGEN